MNNEVVESIQKLVEKVRDENHIINPIIRDDVFSILQACKCTVLYYPLEGENKEGCDGCHVQKPVGDNLEQFVFINTNNTRERQAFSAAHELGHIWDVDLQIMKEFPNEQLDAEEIINRFAAEILMPESLFLNVMADYLKKINHQGPTIKAKDLIELIAYLMNYFFVPFKAVVYRFIELDKLKSEFGERILKYKDSQILDEIIVVNQYTRLNIRNQLKSMDNLQEYWEISKQKELLSKRLLAKVQEIFGFDDLEEELSGEYKLEE